MNVGFWACAVLVPFFVLFGLLFGLGKGKSAKFVSGFQNLSKEEQEACDTARLARDMRNACFLWAAVMLAGALGSWLLGGYFALLAYAVWLFLFFRDVHMDAHKAFKKYLP